MGLVERIQAALAGGSGGVERAWPVGQGTVWPADLQHGHDDSRFSPESYEDYVVSSNEIYSAATLRARLMSGLRLRLYRGEGPSRREITSGPAYDLLRHVNPYWTPRRLAWMDELSMCVWGESYWAIERDPDGVPREIWWMKPSRVRPVPDENNYLRGFVYEPIVGGESIAFGVDEVVWFRYPNLIDEFSPLSPLAAARLAADTGSEMMKANRHLFTNGLMAGGLIVPTTDKVVFAPEQAQELERLLERRWTGADKAHRWSVLRFEAQLKELGVTPKDAEFLGGLNLTLRQVANAYGIPSPLLNDMEYATLANVRELLKALWTLTLVPDSQLRAAEIAEQLLPRFPGRGADSAEYDYRDVPELQESASEQWARERQAIEVGRKTINEVRRDNGEPPVPWGDVWWCPVNKAPVSGPEFNPGGAGEGDAGREADLPTLITAAGVLIRAGFDPAASLRAVGLDPIEHLGLLPVTLQKPAEETGPLPEPTDGEVADAIETAKSALPADPDSPADDGLDPEAGQEEGDGRLLLSALTRRQPGPARPVNGHPRARKNRP